MIEGVVFGTGPFFLVICGSARAYDPHDPLVDAYPRMAE